MRGLYVHVPFCGVKCFYCDFTAFSGQRAQVTRYLRAVRAEFELAIARGRAPSLARGRSHGGRKAEARFDTLYIGGGTPSELSAADTAGLLAMFRGPFREATFEACPDSLDAGKIEALRRGGITRLSLGLQTAEDRLLRAIGRHHGWDDFRRVYGACRAAGFSLNVDLMYALPGQTAADAERSLDAVLELEPDHLSLYGLQVEDRTLFGKREVEVDEDLARAMFEAALDRLADAGFEHYEISNFARPGRQSVHNRNYWVNGEYLGLGCGASSFLAGERRANHDRLEDYCAAVEAGRSPTASSERLEGRRALGERVLLGLRLLEGIEWTEELENAFPRERRFVEERGWVSLLAGRMRLTRDGVFLANRVFAEFVAPFRTPACVQEASA